MTVRVNDSDMKSRVHSIQLLETEKKFCFTVDRKCLNEPDKEVLVNSIN